MNWHPFILSLKVGALAAVLIFCIGLALALVLVRKHFAGKTLLETLILLPLVLPPSVLGYYLLLSLGQSNPIMRWLDWRVIFSWPAAVIAAAIVGLPLMVQASRAAIANVDPSLENAARTLGSSEWEVLWRVTLPLAHRGVLAGIVLGATRALGEFGATLMIAGSIPGRTQTLPLAIFEAVQNREYHQANVMVVLMTAFAMVSLWAVRCMEPRSVSRS